MQASFYQVRMLKRALKWQQIREIFLISYDPWRFLSLDLSITFINSLWNSTAMVLYVYILLYDIYIML